MGFFDAEYEEEERPRRRRKTARDADRLGWQDLVEEVEDEPEDEDTIQELEIDDHGRMRRSSRDEIDPDFWNQDDE